MISLSGVFKVDSIPPEIRWYKPMDISDMESTKISVFTTDLGECDSTGKSMLTTRAF